MSNARTLASLIDDTNTRIKIPSGYGLDFADYGAEDSNSATTVNSNKMSDYEIGKWQPAFTHSGTSGSVTAATMTAATQATYIRIGNIVTLFIPALTITANTASPSTSTLYLGGFPFTIANSTPFATANYNGGGFTTLKSNWTTAAPDFLRGFSGQTRGGLYSHTTTSITTTQTGYIATNAYLEMVITYPTI